MVARRLASEFEAPLFFSKTSRLLVELNRSPGHPRLFSEYTCDLDDDDKARIVAQYYEPYRSDVETAIGKAAARGRVLHLSSHSFTPVMDGVTRHTDVGLLYDPQRPLERQFCDELVPALRLGEEGLRVRRNYPYKGTSDGLTTYLRRQFSATRYAGIELEMNQACDVGVYLGALIRALRTVVA